MFRSGAEEQTHVMRILLVEDDRKVGAFLEEGLRQEGFLVDWAQDGDAAVELADAGAYDIVLLDFMLPKKDGLQVARDIRRLDLQTPILMLTARDSAEDVRRGSAAGVNDYMGKPFKFDDLLDHIRALVSPP
jgi:two-component system, OmpR family, copper resistance phosphate regulon response regulator CusR